MLTQGCSEFPRIYEKTSAPTYDSQLGLVYARVYSKASILMMLEIKNLGVHYPKV
jgi:hypothetical protein